MTLHWLLKLITKLFEKVVLRYGSSKLVIATNFCFRVLLCVFLRKNDSLGGCYIILMVDYV